MERERERSSMGARQWCGREGGEHVPWSGGGGVVNEVAYLQMRWWQSERVKRSGDAGLLDAMNWDA